MFVKIWQEAFSRVKCCQNTNLSSRIMNTKISYLYRDASNYKLFNEVIIEGSLKIEQLKPFLFDEQFFVPEQLNIPRLQFEIQNEDDHDWHEIESLEDSNEKPNLEITATQLLELAKLVKKY